MIFLKSFRSLKTHLIAPLMLLLLFSQLCADEKPLAHLERKAHRSTARDSGLVGTSHSDFRTLSLGIVPSTIESPPQPRVSRSRQPLRQIRLRGADQFTAECLSWDLRTATFRLQNGQEIHLPGELVATVHNPPGEVDLPADASANNPFDQSQRLTEAYRFEINRPGPVRIEFEFQSSIVDSQSHGGEWRIEWQHHGDKQPPLVIRVGNDHWIKASGNRSADEAAVQKLKLQPGKHSFVAISDDDRIRMMIDDLILASVTVVNPAFTAIEILPPEDVSNNSLQIGGFQVRRLATDDQLQVMNTNVPSSGDRIELAAGDQLFGHLIELDNRSAVLETFGQRQSISWNHFVGINWQQGDKQIAQAIMPRTGVIAEIELQTFTDRPQCEPDLWSVAIVQVDADQLLGLHPFAGEMRFFWSEIRRVKSAFYGKSQVLDARQFHLGNSIRTDFHRQMPDGTGLSGVFELPEVPPGTAYFSLNVAELEAASADAPPASPFLAELRAGHLATELFVNQQRIGPLNALVRLKANSRSPERIRMEIPRSLLKPGQNNYQLKQQPLKQGGGEFDDCEVGDFRLEFEIR